MNILFCNYEYPPLGGGGGVVNAWLAEALAKTHQVTVLTSSAYGLGEDEMVNGVRVVRVPVYFRNKLQAANMPSLAAYIVNGMRRGKKLLGEQHIDVVNTHFVIPTGPVGHYLTRKAGIPNVLSVHGGDLYDPSKFMSPHRHVFLREPAKRLLRAADLVVGQSNNTIENVKRYYDDSISCELVPLGIPRINFDDASRSTFDLSEDDFVLVTIGRLVSRKGVDQLIDILGNMRNSNAKLLVIGGGPKQEEWENLVSEKALGHKIRFVGQVTEAEKHALLACADLYVSTSQHEGFGLVFLEGMAAGLPVVCYNHGGQTDFIKNGSNGYLVELGDKNTFEQRLRMLEKDKGLLSQLSVASLETVEQYFIDRCASRYETLFKAAIEKHSQTAENPDLA